MMTLTNEHIHQSNLVEGINSVKEDEQSWKAWEYIIAKDKLTNVNIRATQRLIVKNQPDLDLDQKGYYRDKSQTNVTVGPYVPPRWEFVKDMMSDWIWIGEHMNFTPWAMHVRFEKIHPFVDGNGRTGRMLMWWAQMRAGEMPTFILAEKRQLYYDGLTSGRDAITSEA